MPKFQDPLKYKKYIYNILGMELQSRSERTKNIAVKNLRKGIRDKHDDAYDIESERTRISMNAHSIVIKPKEKEKLTAMHKEFNVANVWIPVQNLYKRVSKTQNDKSKKK